ncbi:MAG: hypothetical protein V1854_04810 [Methanobacteriota archaeon]
MPNKAILDPQLARQFLNIMGAIVDEFRLSISKDGWKAVAVDPANVALVDIDLPKDNFLSYEFESDNWTSSIDGHPTGVLEEELKVGIDINKIITFIGYPDKKEMLDEEMHEPMEFIFSNAPPKYGNRYQLQLKQGMFSRTMLLLPESEIRRSPEKPILHVDYMLQLKGRELQRIVEEAAKVSDDLRLGFRREEEGITFIASTVDGEGFPWDATKQLHGWEALSDKARDSSSSLFSLDYLCDITEVIPSETVWLHIGHDNPCIISFILGQTGTVEYKIAPRIQDE